MHFIDFGVKNQRYIQYIDLPEVGSVLEESKGSLFSYGCVENPFS